MLLRSRFRQVPILSLSSVLHVSWELMEGNLSSCLQETLVPGVLEEMASIKQVGKHSSVPPLLNLSYLFLRENRPSCDKIKILIHWGKAVQVKCFPYTWLKLLWEIFIVIGPMISETRFLSGGYSAFITTSNWWNI